MRKAIRVGLVGLWVLSASGFLTRWWMTSPKFCGNSGFSAVFLEMANQFIRCPRSEKCCGDLGRSFVISHYCVCIDAGWLVPVASYSKCANKKINLTTLSYGLKNRPPLTVSSY